MRTWLLLTALFAGACDFPTDLPILEPRFVLPVDSTNIAVTQLVPTGVTVRGDSFLISLESARISQGIVQLCGDSCRTIQGVSAPKPAFTSTFTVDVPFPADLNSVSGASGAISVTLSNNFSFDPIRPSADVPGSIKLVLLADSIPIARDSVLGSETAFAPGSTISRSLTISTPEVTPPLTVTVTIDSPAGDPVTVNARSSFDLTAAAEAITAGSVNVNVRDRPVRAQQLSVDLTGLDESLEDHIKLGAMKLTIVNPFPVSGTMTATFAGNGVEVAPKTFALVPGRSIQIVQMTVPELQSMIGSLVTVTVAGVVNAPGGGVTVFPANALSISIDFDMTLTTENSKE